MMPRSRPISARVRRASLYASGKQVGDDPVGQYGDLILEHQLALLQPGNLDLVDRAGCPKRFDLLIESAMLGLEQEQDLPRIVVVHAATYPSKTKTSPIAGTAVGGRAAMNRVIEARQQRQIMFYCNASLSLQAKE